MYERWKIDGSNRWIHGLEVAPLLNQRVRREIFDSRFLSDQGRRLAFLTNGVRARVRLMSTEADSGDYVIDPTVEADTASTYTLGDGREIELPDNETVVLAEAIDLAVQIISDGTWPEGTPLAPA